MGCEAPQRGPDESGCCLPQSQEKRTLLLSLQFNQNLLSKVCHQNTKRTAQPCPTMLKCYGLLDSRANQSEDEGWQRLPQPREEKSLKGNVSHLTLIS